MYMQELNARLPLSLRTSYWFSAVKNKLIFTVGPVCILFFINYTGSGSKKLFHIPQRPQLALALFLRCFSSGQGLLT